MKHSYLPSLIVFIILMIVGNALFCGYITPWFCIPYSAVLVTAYLIYNAKSSLKVSSRSSYQKLKKSVASVTHKVEMEDLRKLLEKIQTCFRVIDLLTQMNRTENLELVEKIINLNAKSVRIAVDKTVANRTYTVADQKFIKYREAKIALTVQYLNKQVDLWRNYELNGTGNLEGQLAEYGKELKKMLDDTFEN